MDLKHNLSMPQQVFSFLIDDNQQPDSKDTKKENEKCSEHCSVNVESTIPVEETAG